MAENVQHFHVPATIVYQYYDHPFQIIHCQHCVRLNFDAASAPIWFDEIVVLRGSINCTFFRPHLVEGLVPLADQYPTRRVCVMCSASSDDQRRVVGFVHFNLNAIPVCGRSS